MLCPKCEIEMTASTETGAETDLCPKCGGVWVDHAEEKQVLEMSPAVFSVDELRRLRREYKPLGRVEDVRYVKCPRCYELMWRINYMHHSGIIVDRCRDHGTFFDRDELQKAVEFIRLGGIEYEKLRIAEKGISELQTRVRKVSDRVDMISFKLPWYARLLVSLGY